MKSKVILFCILLFSSKIVDSNPHSEDFLRQRVNSPSIWQGNQNGQDAQYLDTDFTQTRKVNTLTNTAIEQDSIQDFSVNQGRHNYKGYDYNISPASSSSGKERLESYNLQTDGRRLEAYSPREESYPSKVGFENQPFRKKNWRPQNLYTNSVPNAVLITDNERPLVNTVQEPYRAPVQYLQPKYIPSSNRRFHQPDRSYVTGEQFEYPLANNAGNSKYVANSGNSHFESSGPVLYENYNEGQARVSEIKAKLTDGQRYLQHLAPQSGNYNVIPVVVATDTLTDQPENIKYVENYRSHSDLSNTASSTNYDDDSPVVENYSIDSRLSNVPESHESYRAGQTATSEIKTRLSDDQRYTRSFAPQSGIIYNESPAVIGTDTLEDQFQNIRSVKNYRSRPDLSETVPKTNYNDDSQVISVADNYNLHSRPNGHVSYEKYSDGQVAVSQVNPRPIETQRYVQNFAPQSRIIYNDIPAVIATDVQSSQDQSSNIRYEKRGNSNSRSDLSNTAPTTNYGSDYSTNSVAETHNGGSRPNNNPVPHDKLYGNVQATLSGVRRKPISGRKYLQKDAPHSRIIYNDVPEVIDTDILADQSDNIRYEEKEEYKSQSDLNDAVPTTNYDTDSSVISVAETHNDGSRLSNSPAALSEDRSRPIGGRKYLHKVAPQSRIIYDVIPTVIATDTLADQSNNIRYEKREDYKSGSDLSNLTPVTNQDDSSPVLSTEDNTDSDFKLSNSASENIHNTVAVDVNTILSDQPLARRYAHNYRAETGLSNTVRDNSFNAAPNVISETIEEKSGAHEVNYGQNEPIPINTYSETSPTSTHTVYTKPKINKIEEDDVPLYGSSSPTPSNNPNKHHKMTELNLNKFQKLVDGNTKPYLVIHPNGTVEHLNTLDLDSQQNSYIRLVNTKSINVGDTEGEEIQSPERVPNNIAKTLVPQNETPLPVDTQPADYRKSTPLNENQTNYAYESDSEVPNKALPDKSASKSLNSKQEPYGENLKPLIPIVNEPADDDNSKLPLVDQQGDGDKFELLRPNIPNRIHHYKSKPTDADQPAFDNNSNPLILDENQLAVKPKPNDSYLSYPDVNQQADVNSANLPLTENQSGYDKNSEPLSHPYKKWSHIHHYKSKLPNINQPTEDSSSNLSSNENQPLDDNNYKTLPLNENQPIADIDSQTLHLHKRKPVHHYKSQHSHLNQPRDVDIAHLSSLSKNKLAGDNNSNPSSSDNNKPTDDNHSKLSNESPLGHNHKFKPIHTHYRQPIYHSEPKLTHENQSKNDESSPKDKPENDKNLKSSSLDETESPKNNPEEDNKTKQLSPHKIQPALYNKPTLSHKDQSGIDKIFPQIKSEDGNNSRLPVNNQSTDDDTSENKPEDDTISKPFKSNHIPIPHQGKHELHTKLKLLHEDESENDKNSPKDKPKDNHNLNSSTPDIFLESKPRIKKVNKPIHPHHRMPAHHNQPKPSYEDQSEKVDTSLQNKPRDDVNSNPSFPEDNELINDDTLSDSKLGKKNKPKPKNPLKRHPGKHNKQNPSYGKQSENNENSPREELKDNKNSNSSSLDDNKSTDYDTYPENKKGDNIKPKALKPHKRKPAFDNKPKQLHDDLSRNGENSTKDKPRDNNDFDSSFSDDDESIGDDTFNESQPINNNKSKPVDDHNFNSSSPDDSGSIDDDAYFESQPRNNKKIKPIHPPYKQTSQEDQSEYDDTFPQNEFEDDENQSEEDDTYSQNNSEDDIDSISTPAGENKLEHNKKQTTVSKIDDQPVSTTLSTDAPNYIKSAKPQIVKKPKHRHIRHKSTTNSPIATTPYPNENSEDQIITLSPIEQVTDHVSDAPLVTTTTTTVKPPTKTPGKSDTIKDTNNKQSNSANSSSEDFPSITNKVETSTKASASSSTTLAGNKNDAKTTKALVSNKNNKVNDNAVESQVSYVKNSTQTVQSTVYNTSKLLDTNTDVLVKSDDNSSVTTSPSVQSDVKTGDGSGANALVYEQPETEIIITVSSSTDFDSEDDIITINVEVFESTGSSSNNKSLLVNIDTNNDSDDDSDEIDYNVEDDGRGKNLEIDVSNLQGEPTIWIKTTNQDFIDKLVDKHDTEFDMVYFYNIVAQPIIEREKLTTIHCNGTVVIETKEITYTNKNDKKPTIVKTTQTMQIEDYKRYGLDSSND